MLHRIESYSVRNPYYQNNVNQIDERYTTFQTRGPLKLMLHSVGVPQPRGEVFAGLWNSEDAEVALHAVVERKGTYYQCLPWNFRGIHAGGVANNYAIGVEMTEPDCIRYIHGSTLECDDLPAAQQFVRSVYDTAVMLFAELCKTYNLDPLKDILSHKEAGELDIASGHGDPEHLWEQLNTGLTMDGFRRDVRENMAPPTEPDIYRIRTSWGNASSQIGAFRDLENAKSFCDQHPGYKVYLNGELIYPITKPKSFLVEVEIRDLNIREGPGLTWDVLGYCPPGIYTIMEIQQADGYHWGELRSGAGWIALEYAKPL